MTTESKAMKKLNRWQTSSWREDKFDKYFPSMYELGAVLFSTVGTAKMNKMLSLPQSSANR